MAMERPWQNLKMSNADMPVKKLKTKHKCHFKCTRILFFGEVISRDREQPDQTKLSIVTEMPLPTNKKEYKSFLGIMNYIGNSHCCLQRCANH